MIRQQLKEQLQEWTVYGIVEGNEDFQKALEGAIDYLELNEKELHVTNIAIVNEHFVKQCYELAQNEIDNQ